MAFDDIQPGPIGDKGEQQCIDPRTLPPDDPRRKFIAKWLRAGLPGDGVQQVVKPLDNPS